MSAYQKQRKQETKLGFTLKYLGNYPLSQSKQVIFEREKKSISLLSWFEMKWMKIVFKYPEI